MENRRNFERETRAKGWLIASLIVLIAGACGTGSSDPTLDVGAGSTATTAEVSAPAVASTLGSAVDQASTTSTLGQDCTAAVDTTTSTETTGTTATTDAPTSTPTTAESSTSTSTVTTAPTSTTMNQEVAAHQQRLTDLGYWLGPVDGQLGPSTAHAITAFQKAEGLPRTGLLDNATVERLSTASRPTAQSSSGRVLEIDLTRQILLVTTGGDVERIYDIATGSSATPTPPGRFEIVREIDGTRHAPLGTLYRPKYFNGGIALHGYTSVPPEPASHGCVRLTYPAMDALWASGAAPIGTEVWVY